MAISAQPERLVITIVLQDLGSQASVRRRTPDGRSLIQINRTILANDPVARDTAFQALLDIAEEVGFTAN